MHPQTKAFVDKLVSDPTLTQTQAYLDTHRTENRRTANSNATQLLNKPSVLAYMASKSDIAEKTIYQVLTNAKKKKDSPQWQRLAKDSANDILDRVHGKALTKTSSLNLNINIQDAISELE